MKDKMTNGAQTMKLLKAIKCILLILLVLFLMACGGGSDSSSTGTLSLGLTDASTNNVKAVYVTINEVQVHFGDEGNVENGNGNWEVVATPKKTYNLLELTNGIIEQLGIKELETGHYTQLRMLIGDTPDDGTNILDSEHPVANYIIDLSDDYHELKIPSGFQTGVKIVHGFDIAKDQIAELVLDFDALKSVIKAGNEGKWILQPTIKVINMLVAGMVGGVVTDNISDDSLANVTVSAQTYDPGDDDRKDWTAEQSRAITDNYGSYYMYLSPGTYNLVLNVDGYSVACRKIEVASGLTYTEDFSLIINALVGTVTGDVTIESIDADQSADLSFRQLETCEGSADEEAMEVISKTVISGDSYSVNLPVGSYDVIASTSGKDTQENTGVEVTEGGTTTVHVSFP